MHLNGVLAFILVISVLTFVHEFGHYIIARACGIKVDIFAIGMGKTLFSIKDKNDTSWQIKLFPVGGFVKMFGDIREYGGEDTELISKMTEKEKSVAFYSKSVAQRFSVVLAGPIANLIFSFILVFLLFLFSGYPVTSTNISSILAGSPAEKAGLLVGDKIIGVNGILVHSFEEMVKLISEVDSVLFQYDRDDLIHQVVVRKKKWVNWNILQ